MKNIIILLLSAICSMNVLSQETQQWVQRYNGSGNSFDQTFTHSLAVDGQGNVYVTGQSDDANATNCHYVTIKYNQAGDSIWVRNYFGTGNSYDVPHAIAVDASGNVYVTGQSYGNGTGFDIATIK